MRQYFVTIRYYSCTPSDIVCLMKVTLWDSNWKFNVFENHIPCHSVKEDHEVCPLARIQCESHTCAQIFFNFGRWNGSQTLADGVAFEVQVVGVGRDHGAKDD